MSNPYCSLLTYEMTFVRNPQVSIITPSFNRELLVAETLDSLLRQSYANWENIVVDDGSSDRTRNIVSEYTKKDSRVKLYERSRMPKGACTCRNQGVDRCSGEYLIFLDSDDLLEPFCVEQRVSAMEAHPELDFAIFPSLMFRYSPNDLGLWWNIEKPVDELTRQFYQDAICQTTGVIWRKDSFNQLGRWDEQLYLWQDIDLFFRAYIQDYNYKKFFDLPPDLHNRRLETSLSRNDFFAREKTLSRVEVIKRAVGLLKNNHKQGFVRKARHMTAEIISGASRSKQYDLARDMIAWGLSEEVLTPAESRWLKILLFVYQNRLSRLPGISSKLVRIEGLFRAESTLGILPFEKRAA